MHQRPRLDLQMPYFVNSYRLEVSCLYKFSKIIRLLVDRMVIILKFCLKVNLILWIILDGRYEALFVKIKWSSEIWDAISNY